MLEKMIFRGGRARVNCDKYSGYLRGSAAKNLQNRLYECPWGSSDLDETLYLELYS